MNTTIIAKQIGWAQSVGTNWCYRYYDITIVSNDLDLLALQGIYTDTFGSVTNYFSDLRSAEGIDFITDDHLYDAKQSIRRMKKLNKGNDLKAIAEIVKTYK